jgi:hypothetical protein
MQAKQAETISYTKCIEISKKVRWDIDKDVIRGRQFDFAKKFLPDGISKIDRLDFLSKDEQRFLSQIQGRTYASMFGFVERFIVAKILEISRNHWLGDQIALEALVRFCDEELKHQELFRRIELMIASGMPPGYTFRWDPNQVAAAVLSKSTWAVLGLIYQIELFTQTHYKESIEPNENLDELYKDLFLFHWKEEVTHAFMDELEWPIEDQKLTPIEREKAVTELIELVADVDGILQAQATDDVEYFRKNCGRSLREEETKKIVSDMLAAYRWQYVFSGTTHHRFTALLNDLTTAGQRQRLSEALATLMIQNPT